MAAELTILLKLRDEASKELAKIKSNFLGLSRATSIGMIAAGGAVLAFGAISVKQFAQTGEELKNLAIKTGLSVEALSVLKYAAELTNISLETIALGIRGMANFLDQANTGGQEAVSTLNRLGISVESLKGLSPEDTFYRMAEAIANVPDPLERSALAVKTFGRAGSELLPMLAEGSEGLDRMRKEAQELGLVFDKEAADTAAEFNNALKQLKGSLIGLQNQLARVVIPAIQPFTDAITDAIKAVRAWTEAHPLLTEAIVKIGGALAAIAVVVGTLSLAWKGIAAVWAVVSGAAIWLGGMLGGVFSGIAAAASWLGGILAGIFGGIAAAIGLPVWAVVALVAAVIAAAVLIVTKWDCVKEHIIAIWTAIKDWFAGLPDWFDNLWNRIVQGAKDIWNAIPLFFRGLWAEIKDIWGVAAGWFDKYVWQPIVAGARWVWDTVTGFFRNLWEDIKDIWDKLLGVLSWGSPFRTGIPGMAAGGIVPGPIGQPVPVIAHGGEQFAGVGKSFGGVIYNVVVNVAGSVRADRDLAQTIRRELLLIGQRNVSVGLA